MKKKALFIPVVICLAAGIASAEEKGKIAVAAGGKDLTSTVSDVAARSPCFLIFDENGRLIESVENPHSKRAVNAADSVVAFLAEKKVKMIVAGDFGRKMIRKMESKGMWPLEFEGAANAGAQKAVEVSKQPLESRPRAGSCSVTLIAPGTTGPGILFEYVFSLL